MEGIVLRVRLITGHSMDVRYEEPDAVSEDEVVDHVVSTLAQASGVLRCRLTIKSDLVLTLWTDIMNNIPGTMVLEIDQVRRIMYVHVLDVSTDKAVADFYRSARLIERLLIRTFERESEWQASPWRSGTEELT